MLHVRERVHVHFQVSCGPHRHGSHRARHARPLTCNARATLALPQLASNAENTPLTAELVATLKDKEAELQEKAKGSFANQFNTIGKTLAKFAMTVANF